MDHFEAIDKLLVLSEGSFDLVEISEAFEHLRAFAELQKSIEQELQGRKNLEVVIIKDRKEAENMSTSS